jgi:hypothetical protein
MKFLFATAARAAVAISIATNSAFAQTSATSAPQAAQTGHYEWRYNPRPGPNKTHLPENERVWIGPPKEAPAARRDEAGGTCPDGMQAGHYVWRTSPRQQPGPRAPLLAPVRVWVASKVKTGMNDATMPECKAMPVTAFDPAKSGDHNRNY